MVGLNLCPFALPVLREDGLRVEVSRARELETITRVLWDALSAFPGGDAHTVLVVFPDAFPDFLDFNDYQNVVEGLLAELGLEGVVQVPTFHPHYRFAGESDEDASHYTNRAPYPMFHLLRESDVDRARQEHPDTLQIPERNVARLRSLGVERVRGILQKCLAVD